MQGVLEKKEVTSIYFGTAVIIAEFKEHMRVDRGTFELILNRISANIYRTPTKMESNPFGVSIGSVFNI